MDIKAKTRPQTPIERAISQSTGDDVNARVPVYIIMQCGKCGRTQSAPSDETDPDGTAVVRALCPECCGGDFSLVDYFDADGNQIMPD